MESSLYAVAVDLYSLDSKKVMKRATVPCWMTKYNNAEESLRVVVTVCP